MRRRLGLLAGGGTVAAVALAGALAAAPGEARPASAASAAAPAVDTSKCVKFAGVETSGNKNSLDPAVQPSSQNSLEVGAAYNRLIDSDSDYRLTPELATSWSSNKKATVWTFHLRKGVTFWDGKPFTSADVVYTFKRLLDPKTGSEGAPTMSFLNPKGIIAKDKYTVIFKTKKPAAELPLGITNKNTYIVENGASTATLRSKGAGTGPFMPVNFQPIQQVHQFVRNPHYWQKGLPKAPCLSLYVIQEATSMQAALQTGQIDAAQQVSYSSISALKKDSHIKLLATGASTSMTFPMWVDTPPFNNNLVREALKNSINRQQMVNTVLQGYGVPGDDNPIPPTSPFAWRHKARQQNIPLAKQELQQAGYSASNPLKVDLYTADMIPGMVNLAQLFKQQAAQAGIQINVIVGPASEYWDNVWLKHPFESSGWSARPPGEGLSIAYLKNAPYPETHWKVPAYDKLVTGAAAVTNPAKRLAMYRKAMKMLSLQGGEIIPVFQKTVAAERTNCTGYKPFVQFVHADFRYVHCSR